MSRFKPTPRPPRDPAVTARYFATWRHEAEELARGFELGVPAILLEFLQFKVHKAYNSWLLAGSVDPRLAGGEA